MMLCVVVQIGGQKQFALLSSLKAQGRPVCAFMPTQSLLLCSVAQAKYYQLL